MLNIITSEDASHQDPEEAQIAQETAALAEQARRLLAEQDRDNIAIEFSFARGEQPCRGLLIVEPYHEVGKLQIPLSVQLTQRRLTPCEQLPAEFEVQLTLTNNHRTALEFRVNFVENEEQPFLLWEGYSSKDILLQRDERVVLANTAIATEHHHFDLAKVILHFHHRQGEFFPLPRR